jgi:type VI secretion system protein ImpK
VTASPNIPSLLSGTRAGTLVPTRKASGVEPRSLLDLMFDGFYLVFLMRNGSAPTDADTFRARVKDFLAQIERGARQIGVDIEDVHLSKYAFCALTDEVVLAAGGAVAAQWERKPLQLELFGDQLAGEAFFDRLEQLRAQGAPKVQVLEVFHLCLLLGFQGKYLIEGSEKLGYLTARLGDEIAAHKGTGGSPRGSAFAPHADAPDRVSHRLRAEVPLWVLGSVMALALLLAFLGLRYTLDRQTRDDLTPYANLIQMPAQSAHITITLP